MDHEEKAEFESPKGGGRSIPVNSRRICWALAPKTFCCRVALLARQNES